MIKLKSFECFVCQKQCCLDADGRFSLSLFDGIGFFGRGLLNRVYHMCCASCIDSGYQGTRVQLSSRCIPASQTLVESITYLANVAPEDELKLLDFGKWNPNICPTCQIPGPLVKFSNSDVDSMCLKCDSNLSILRYKFFCNSLNELAPHFLNIPYSPVQRKPPLSLSQFFPCSDCGREATRFSLLPYSEPLLFCERYASPDYEHLDQTMLWKLTQFIQCVPDPEGLRPLTYSKWTPFCCPLCSMPYEDDFRKAVFHPDCKTTCCSHCHVDHRCCKNEEKRKRPIYLPFIMSAAGKLRPYFGQTAHIPVTDNRKRRATCKESFDVDLLKKSREELPSVIRSEM